MGYKVNIQNVLWNEMIFCLPYEVCDCLSKSIASTAFMARFNFLFSDVIKGWFKTCEQGLPNQWADLSLTHCAPLSTMLWLVPKHPHMVPQSCLYFPTYMALSLSSPQSPLPCRRSNSRLSLDSVLEHFLCAQKNTNFIITKANTPDIYNLALGTRRRGEKHWRKNILPCFQDIQKL